MGKILMAAAAIFLTTGIITQVFSENETPANTPLTKTSTNQATAAPVSTTPQPDVSLSGETNPGAAQPQTDAVALLIHQAFQLIGQSHLDAAMDKVNAALQVEPQNSSAHKLRGYIYAKEKLWDQAEKEYQTALQFGGKNASIKFNLAEIQFMQKKYDAARPGYAALQQDPDMGDLSSYMVFLCDLLAGHEEVANKELEAFNQVGANASYYFANAASSLYHQKPSEARDWLNAAKYIYPPAKYNAYANSLVDLVHSAPSSQPSPPASP